MTLPSITPDGDDRLVGSRVRSHRLRLGLSQKALASSLGIEFDQMQAHEHGTISMDAELLLRVTAALGMDPRRSAAGDKGSDPDEVLPFRPTKARPAQNPSLRTTDLAAAAKAAD